MGEQPYGYPDPDRRDDATQPGGYGYSGEQRSEESGYRQEPTYYRSIKPGKGERNNAFSILGSVLNVVGICLFLLPFLYNFGILDSLGLTPALSSPEGIRGGFKFMQWGFVGFLVLMVGQFFKRRSGKD